MTTKMGLPSTSFLEGMKEIVCAHFPSSDLARELFSGEGGYVEIGIGYIKIGPRDGVRWASDLSPMDNVVSTVRRVLDLCGWVTIADEWILAGKTLRVEFGKGMAVALTFEFLAVIRDTATATT